MFEYGAQGGGSVSSFDGGLLIGLDAAAKADSIEIRWPSGTTQEIKDVGVDKTVRVVEPRANTP
jgi:hypothetical protein